MELKYYFEFTDVKEILHRCEIYKDDFVGDAIEIQGSLALTKASTEDTLEAIRGGGLKIDLEATNLLSFDDLYSENERVFSVKYIRNTSVLLFHGWLSPEGLVESFVNDTWIISLDCTDGLGFLKNLSYVENNGVPFSGKQSALEIITNCLKRTNLEQNIFTSLNIFHENMLLTENVLVETYFNSNRFVKDDDKTFMNCDEVLRSVLELFGACITQYQGAWYIYKPNEIVNSTSLSFFAYDSDGIAKVVPKVAINFAEDLGSQINDFYPHHVNANQQLTIDSSIGAYRINYKYGLVRNLFNNIYLESNTTPPNFYVDDWNILDFTYIDFPLDNVGVLFDSVSSGGSVQEVISSDSFSVDEGNVLNVYLEFSPYSYTNNGTVALPIKIKLQDNSSSDVYYLDSNFNWRKNSDVNIQYTHSIQQLDSVFAYEIKTPGLPVNGDVSLIVGKSIDRTGSGITLLRQFNFSADDVALANIKGENHTFQIVENPSTKISENKEVYNGDNPSDIYVGTIYEGDETTPTEFWFRNELFVRFIPLIRIMGEERMKMYAKPLRVFTGDVFGYVDYLSAISIDGINGVLFMPIEYDYDALTNITTLKLKQILDEPLITELEDKIDYNLTFDYGNVVEPTIKG